MSPSTLAIAATSAMAIGLTLGLIGGGGSVLTVPVFAYLLGYPAKQAIAMSLPVVGLTSLVGAARHWRAGNLVWRTALAFGAVAMVGSYGGARLARFLDGRTQLVGLGVVMVAAAVSMLRSAASPAPIEQHVTHHSLPVIALAGVGVGVLTGLVGIGGGFLIVPALVVLVGVPMRQAVGTSLAVISMNAASGFLGYAGTVQVDWPALGLFAGVAIAGILVGTQLHAQVTSAQLKRGFALFLLVVASFILYQNRGILTGS
ncbi:MAG: sulfite exporter TauE/SafE family protein [Gemmatimonadetes bacterium]|nr:sulfite exporter TauE/SafE family protein [Gemmatimonadota bacterium]